jgi:NADH-quinone oxidoreductase subunit A
MTETILFSPPFVFIILFFITAILFWFCSRYAFRKKEKSPGAKKAYACGEDFQEHLIQPDYSQFFPFAFFFTILHVVALVIATVPAETIGTFAIAVAYVIGAIMGLIILLRH